LPNIDGLICREGEKDDKKRMMMKMNNLGYNSFSGWKNQTATLKTGMMNTKAGMFQMSRSYRWQLPSRGCVSKAFFLSRFRSTRLPQPRRPLWKGRELRFPASCFLVALLFLPIADEKMEQDVASTSTL
jgi:hypothetical protein